MAAAIATELAGGRRTLVPSVVYVPDKSRARQSN